MSSFIYIKSIILDKALRRARARLFQPSDLPGSDQAWNINEKVRAIENIWKKYADGIPFEYSFIDQAFDTKLGSENRLKKIFLLFTIVAVAIACLGLFGLSSFVVEQRSKEISIRKVLGASVRSLLTLLSNIFSRLILIAFVLSVPPSIYLIDRWLTGLPTGLPWTY